MSSTKETKRSKLFVAYIIFLIVIQISFIITALSSADILPLITGPIVLASAIGILYRKRWARITYFVVSGIILINIAGNQIFGHTLWPITVVTSLLIAIPYYELMKNKQHYLS